MDFSKGYLDPDREEKKKEGLSTNKKIVWAVAVIFLLFLVGLLVYYAHSNGSGKSGGSITREQAIETVQNYGQDIGGSSGIIDSLSSAAMLSGTDIQVIGWDAELISDGVWLVVFEWDEEGFGIRSTSWKLYTDTDKIIAQDTFASDLMTMAEG